LIRAGRGKLRQQRKQPTDGQQRQIIQILHPFLGGTHIKACPLTAPQNLIRGQWRKPLTSSRSGSTIRGRSATLTHPINHP
jgi:hypothetical protein